MALTALLLKQKLDLKRKELENLKRKDEEFATREADLAKAIAEVNAETAEEDRSVLDDLVKRFDEEKEAHENEKADLEKVIGEMEADLAAEEAKQATDPAPASDPEPEKKDRKEGKIMNIEVRNEVFGRMSMLERTEFCAREDVQNYLKEVRTAIKEKRAISNIGVLIPEVMLTLLRENIENYSKLFKHVYVQRVSGEARTPVMGGVPEAIWTECCANLNELSLTFYDATVDCFKVAGYFAVCNANLEDSDLDLAAELLSAIGQAIGLALDKAILYGRNSSTAQNMPLGVVSRLAQTAQPSGYPATARPWEDLHTSNIITIAAENTGVALFQQILLAGAAMQNNFARGDITWVMNRKTYTTIMAQAMTFDASGNLVAIVNGKMPVIGGNIEILNFIPDNVIIAGYFELYLLAERAGQKFATSEHVRFLQDQTVMKGTARYDGQPVVAEGFMVVGINGTTPVATGVTFAADTANS